MFIEHGLKPVWIFKQNIEKVMNTEGIRETLKPTNSKAGQAAVIPFAIYKDLKVLLKHLGIPIIESSQDAEAECARLANQDNGIAVISEDLN